MMEKKLLVLPRSRRMLNKLLFQRMSLNSSLPHEAWNIVLHDMKIGVENSKAQMSALFHFSSFVDLDGRENLHHGLWMC